MNSLFLRGAEGHQEDLHVSDWALEMTGVFSGGEVVLGGILGSVWANKGTLYVGLLYRFIFSLEYLKIMLKISL